MKLPCALSLTIALFSPFCFSMEPPVDPVKSDEPINKETKSKKKD